MFKTYLIRRWDYFEARLIVRQITIVRTMDDRLVVRLLPSECVKLMERSIVCEEV